MISDTYSVCIIPTMLISCMLNLNMVIALILTLPVFIWLMGAIWIRKDRCETLDPTRITRLLIIFPHPDDETFSAAGLIATLIQQKKKVSVRCLTHGEKGLKHGEPRDIRVGEFQKVMQTLSVADHKIEDFGDGMLQTKTSQIETYVRGQIESIQPTHVVTFDTSGLYGHPDHIALADAVTQVVADHPEITLMYTTLPQTLMSQIRLPTHMATDPDFVRRRLTPTHRLLILPYLITKLRCIYSHQTQMDGFYASKPRFLPLWFTHSLMIDEYFHIVSKQ